MIKKTLVAVGGLSLLMVLFFGRDAVSYVRTSFGWVRDSVKSQVPVEFEIERARRMVKNLVPDIRKQHARDRPGRGGDRAPRQANCANHGHDG